MFLITTSLLNSWAYLFKVDEQYYEKSYEEFVAMLKKEPFEPNQYMLAGIAFEDKCIAGEVPGISNKITDGSYQYKGKVWKTIDGIEYLVYGKLDVLKAGIIYDIKLNTRYSVGKYFDSYQHHIYMELVPEASKFVYLIGVENGMAKQDATGDDYTIFEETYTRDECRPIDDTIREFVKWLEVNKLLDVYHEKWPAYNEQTQEEKK